RGVDIGTGRAEQRLVGLRLMGASVELEGGEYVARADRLKGATIHLDMPTVPGTENLMMSAATADGITTCYTAGREPHVVDLAMFLGKMGDRIHGIGTDVLEIEGVPELSGATHRVIPDNIEAGTYAFAIAATGGEGVLEDVETADLRAMMLKLRAAGVEVEDRMHSLWVRGNSDLQPVDVTTWPHPGCPTAAPARRSWSLPSAPTGRPCSTTSITSTVATRKSWASSKAWARTSPASTARRATYVTTSPGSSGIESAVLSKKIGIDLGTSTVLVYVKGEGVVVNEPAVMATDEKGARVLAVGRAASEMVGRGRKARAVRLVRDGNGVDYNVAGAMLQHLIGRIVGRQRIFRPDVMLSVAAMGPGVA